MSQRRPALCSRPQNEKLMEPHDLGSPHYWYREQADWCTHPEEAARNSQAAPAGIAAGVEGQISRADIAEG